MLTAIFYCQSRMILQFVPIYSGDWSPFSYISCVKPFVDESILLSGLWQIFVLLYMKLLLLCCCVHVFVFITPLTLRTWYVYLQHLWRQCCSTVSFVLPWCWHQIKTVHCNPSFKTALTVRPKCSLTGLVRHQGGHRHGNRRVLESDLTEGWSITRFL